MENKYIMPAVKGPLAFVRGEQGCGVVRVTVRNSDGISGFVMLWFEGEHPGTRLPWWFSSAVWDAQKMHEL